MHPELIQSPVVVTNSTGIHGPVVAEHAIAVLLALAKRLPQAMRYQAKKLWSQEHLWKERPRPREVEGATVAVVCMRSIGTEFAHPANALRTTVLTHRDNPHNTNTK